MALIKCKECGKEISDKAMECTHCGATIDLYDNQKNKKQVDVIMLIFLIAGAILLIVGLAYEIPSREFSFYGLKEYVGGDAYNAIIEASLRGGEIAGAKTAKAIYICSGIMTMLLSLLKIKTNKKVK